jgi:hypothetical protein
MFGLGRHYGSTLKLGTLVTGDPEDEIRKPIQIGKKDV